MDDKEIEQKLKESAQKIKAKDFEERWATISERIDADQSQDGGDEVQSAVLVTSANTVHTVNSLRKKFLFAFCGIVAAIAICLAIVLPIVLGKDKGQKYYYILNLTNESVSESEFFDGIEQSDLTLFDLTDFELDTFSLYYTADGGLAGGGVEVIDESLEIFAKLVFYTNNVRSDFEVGTDYSEYVVNGYNVNYKTENAEVFYTTKAKATKGSMVYELTITAADDNPKILFDKLFG